MSMRSDGIIQTVIKDDCDVRISDAELLMDAYLKLGKGKKIPHLIVFGEFAMADRSVLEYMAEEANAYGKADAVVITSMAHKILANFYLKFQKPSVPTKFFKAEDEAVEWLQEYVD